MNEETEVVRKLSEYGVVGYSWLLLMAFWGGTTRYLADITKRGEKFSFAGWLIENVICIFCGFVAALACQYSELDFFLTSAITAIAAHNGTRTLYIVSEIVRAKK